MYGNIGMSGWCETQCDADDDETKQAFNDNVLPGSVIRINASNALNVSVTGLSSVADRLVDVVVSCLLNNLFTSVTCEWCESHIRLPWARENSPPIQLSLRGYATAQLTYKVCQLKFTAKKIQIRNKIKCTYQLRWNTFGNVVMELTTQ